MRVLAVVSTQLMHHQLVDGQGAGPIPPAPQPMIVHDLRTSTHERSPA
jgi:hypothetical protein